MLMWENANGLKSQQLVWFNKNFVGEVFRVQGEAKDGWNEKGTDLRAMS